MPGATVAFPLGPLLPVLILGGGGVVLLMLDAIWPRDRRLDASILGVPLTLAAAVALVLQWRNPHLGGGLGGLLVADAFGAVIGLIVCLSLLLSLLLSQEHLRQMGRYRGEYFALLLLSAAGMLLFAQATDLVGLFVGLELLSLPVYILSGFLRKDPKSNEAGLKYFLLGAFASAVFLYGAALIYGATGQMDLVEAFRTPARMPALRDAGLVLLLGGLLFKVAVVPFHMWVPDVYEGAPTGVTAFMATAVKASAFGALVRVLLAVQPGVASIPLAKAFWWLAVLTMTVGNLAALTQSNVKRMLAYSSIAHAGYLLVGITAMLEGGATTPVSGILYYLVAYTFMNLCAFGVVVALARDGKEILLVHEMDGLGWERPWLGLAMILAMVGLSGIPPTAGFFAKYYVFQSAVEAGLVGLVVIGVLNSALSVYYYLRVLVAMYMKPALGAFPRGMSASVGFVLAVSGVAILWIAVGPDLLLPSFPKILGWMRHTLVALP
jgi:NADH-quinone oxidoreductase subunit N